MLVERRGFVGSEDGVLGFERPRGFVSNMADLLESLFGEVFGNVFGKAEVASQVVGRPPEACIQNLMAIPRRPYVRFADESLLGMQNAVLHGGALFGRELVHKSPLECGFPAASGVGRGEQVKSIAEETL